MGKDIKYLSPQQQIHKVSSLLSRMYLVTHFTVYQPIEKGKAF